MEANINIETNKETDKDDDSDGAQCETDEDHEIDEGSIDLIEMDDDEVYFVMICERCGAQAVVCATNPKIKWGEPADD